MNVVHTCLLHKGFCMVYFGSKEKCGCITTQCTKETYIFGENRGNVKNKEITIYKEN